MGFVIGGYLLASRPGAGCLSGNEFWATRGPSTSLRFGRDDGGEMSRSGLAEPARVFQLDHSRGHYWSFVDGGGELGFGMQQEPDTDRDPEIDAAPEESRADGDVLGNTGLGERQD